MILTVFRSRLNSEKLDGYDEWGARMDELAKSMPGYISHKSFTADDGERLTVVEFETEEQQLAWANLPQHREAQSRGRAGWYAEYAIQVCTVNRHHRFTSGH